MLQITDETFQSAFSESKKPILIEFFAEWCMPCKVMAPRVQEIENECEEVLVCQADVDANNTLCSQLRISSVPTCVLVKEGTESGRLVGIVSKDDILRLIDSKMVGV